MSTVNVIILAAGKGSRMHSEVPKVLHPIAGKPMLHHVLDTVTDIHPTKIHVITGHGKEQIMPSLKHRNCQLILQSELLGTGHAVQQAVPHIDDHDRVVILYGDMPLISKGSLTTLLGAYPKEDLVLLTLDSPNPTGYGRVLRDNGAVTRIVEEKDATPKQRRITEIYTGIMVAPGKALKRWLSQLTNHNAQQEYYLTDIIELAHKDRCPIHTVSPQAPFEAEGVNTRHQLAHLERVYQRSQADRLLDAGVMLSDPARFDLRGTLKHGQDVIIDINVIIEGDVTVGDRVSIGAGAILRNCILDDDVMVKPYTVIEGSHLKQGATVGPFAHLRPGTTLHENAHVGNFVELKKTSLGPHSKAGHLSYLGDSEIGANVNIGAGTITCNYDGANKHTTHIADDVFVGSDTQFVAPVTVGKGATIGAGTTVTQNVGDNELVLSRVKQQHISGWKKPTKKK